MLESNQLSDETRAILAVDPTGPTNREALLEAYRRESALFQERVRQRLDAGERVLRVPFGPHDSKCAIVELRRLQQLESQHVSLINDPVFRGYVPVSVYCSIKAFHNFLPGTLTQSTNDAESRLRGTIDTLNELIHQGVPPFRTIPRYELIVINSEGQGSYFPIADYVIYFGAGLLGIQAKDRRDKGQGEIMTANATAIRLFSQKAVVNGVFDPVAAKHLIRVVRSKFASEETADSISERMLREADSLASKLEGLFPHPRVLRPLPETLRPLEAYQCMSSDSYWYLYHSDADRIRLAQAYLALEHHEDRVMLTSRQLKSFHQAASLILDSLPDPSQIIKSRSGVSSSPFENVDLNELKTISSKTVRENGWEREIASLILQRLRDIPDSTSREILAKIFFGPQVSTLKVVGVSSSLDSLEQVKAAVDQGRLDLLKKLTDDVLQEVVAEGFRTRVLMKRIKFCGGAQYRQLANAKFEALQ